VERIYIYPSVIKIGLAKRTEDDREDIQRLPVYSHQFQDSQHKHQEPVLYESSIISSIPPLPPLTNLCRLNYVHLCLSPPSSPNYLQEVCRSPLPNHDASCIIKLTPKPASQIDSNRLKTGRDHQVIIISSAPLLVRQPCFFISVILCRKKPLPQNLEYLPPKKKKKGKKPPNATSNTTRGE
jgi:hypothetical protein